MNNKTLEYYNLHAKFFAVNTLSVDFLQIQSKFSDQLKPDAYILDFGCGSGRDARYFLSQGYKVDAIDASSELCRIASEYTGIKVRQMLFEELQEQEKYDGIWACASILHVPKMELSDILQKMCNALKMNGIIYTSFKYGDFEGFRNERYFSDFTEESFCEVIKNIRELTIEKIWITDDVRDGRKDEKWLNIILHKGKIC